MYRTKPYCRYKKVPRKVFFFGAFANRHVRDFLVRVYRVIYFNIVFPFVSTATIRSIFSTVRARRASQPRSA